LGKGEKGTPAKPQENAVRLEFHTIVIDGEDVIINGVKRRDFAKTIQNLEKMRIPLHCGH
jgi:ATP-dependent DNA ligase